LAVIVLGGGVTEVNVIDPVGVGVGEVSERLVELVGRS